MEIIDKPLNEIIKEQKIGESLRRNRRGGRAGSGGGDRSRQGQGQGQGQSQRQGQGQGQRQGAGQGQRSRQGGRLRLRLRRGGRRAGGAAGAGGDGGRRRLSRPPRGGRRFAIDLGDVRRERSAKSGPRRRVMDFDRNDRTRASRRREALSRARFSRD